MSKIKELLCATFNTGNIIGIGTGEGAPHPPDVYPYAACSLMLCLSLFLHMPYSALCDIPTYTRWSLKVNHDLSLNVHSFIHVIRSSGNKITCKIK